MERIHISSLSSQSFHWRKVLFLYNINTLIFSTAVSGENPTGFIKKFISSRCKIFFFLLLVMTWHLFGRYCRWKQYLRFHSRNLFYKRNFFFLHDVRILIFTYVAHQENPLLFPFLRELSVEKIPVSSRC